MLVYKKGNIFESDAEAFVNTVNTQGVMGKGIALQFKEAFSRILKFIKMHVVSVNLHLENYDC